MGQAGTFALTIADVPVQVTVDFLGGLGMYGDNLVPHFEIRIVDNTRPFLSSSGYRSFFVTMTDTEPGLTLAEAISRILTSFVANNLKGKLEVYSAYKGYSPAFRRQRMIEDGIISPAEEPEPTEDDTPVEDYDSDEDSMDGDDDEDEQEKAETVVPTAQFPALRPLTFQVATPASESQIGLF